MKKTMRTYQVLAVWKGDDSKREIMGLNWSNGETKEIDSSFVEDSSYAEDFAKDEWDGFDTGDFKMNNRQGMFTSNDLSVYWHVERAQGGSGNWFDGVVINEFLWDQADMEVLNSFIRL